MKSLALITLSIVTLSLAACNKEPITPGNCFDHAAIAELTAHSDLELFQIGFSSNAGTCQISEGYNTMANQIEFLVHSDSKRFTQTIDRVAAGAALRTAIQSCYCGI